MPQMVKVHLIHPMNFRENKTDEYTNYPSGVQEMPLETAKALGVTRRIVAIQTVGDTEVVSKAPFGGSFEDKLVKSLNAAGYTTLDDLRTLSQDDLLAIEGVGPAAVERIHSALKGAQ